jgi:imidazoleglycerol-phosphate dehydratase
VPLDEALSRVVVDLSGRPGLVFNVPFTRAMIGEFDVDLVHEFFQGLVNHAPSPCTSTPARRQRPPPGETVFKAFARACAWRWKPIRVRPAPCPRPKGPL